MPKKGVLLLNLGSPASTSVSDVRRYLREFLMDPRVLDAPDLIRWIIVNLFILPTRPQKSAQAYASIWTENGSPLIVVSEQYASKIREKVSIPVYLGMRYGNPSTESQIDAMIRDGVEEVLIFPLYPHYAMSSYESALVCATDLLKAKAPDIEYRVVKPFFQDSGYVDCLIDQAHSYLEKGYDHLLFSFHGVPERHLIKGDPSHAHCLSKSGCCEREHPAHATCYRHQCLATVRAFVKRAGIPEGKYSVSFQSRLGKDPWLQPYTDKTVESFPGRGVRKLLVICPAFVTDCLETLEEISVEAKEIFLHAGGESFEQIPCLNVNPNWIDYSCNLIETFVNDNPMQLPLIQEKR